ncbi:MAG: hypothetical protein CVT88_01595 [Candidatus Altiarchaeales archaeon HGW-Altiarchaeales-1]|nr:MAG: hypothetical protein CVT88_01595 [Candidatus Altiarchaeales archaeon HGW-Altiarchaeales-1]
MYSECTMKIKIKGNIPIITPIMIKGSREKIVRMLWDTGARVTMLSWKTLEFCGYEPYLIQKTASVTTANGVVECPIIKVREISLGKFKAKNIDVISHDIPELIRIEGLIGLNFIENFRVCIDYKKGCMEIE